MRKPIFILGLIVMYNIQFAQKNSPAFTSGTIYTATCNSSLTNIKVENEDETSIKNYLLKNTPELNYPGAGMQLSYFKTSPAGKHYTFQQLYNGIPVYNSSLKANLDLSKNIRSIMNESHNLSFINSSAINSQISQLNQAGFSAGFIAATFDYSPEFTSEINICLTDRNTAVAVQKLEVWDVAKGLHRLMLVDESKNIIYQQDLKRYHHFSNGPDTTITGKVFKPDPLTTAHVAYGTTYVDNNDADNASLTAQLVSVSMPATYTAGTFSLKNAYVQITELEAPTVAVVTSTTPVFDFTRSQSGFEDVNSFYHITTMQLYLQSLGYNNLMNQLIKVDSHGDNGQDNSYFSGSGGQPILSLGEGGVDDAEDADVIVHEYGHAVSWSANNNGFGSSDRGALDEAFGDYQAATYSRSIDNYHWADIFSWDGHNPFWPGRSAATSKIYPTNLVGEIHDDGEIWSSAMMDIWTVLVKTTTDKLMYQSIYNWSSNMTMPQAALLVFQADTLQNAGANFSVLCNAFKNHGLYNGNCSTGIDEHPVTSAVEIINSANFAAGNGSLFILFPNFEKRLQVEVYDVSGRKVYQAENENNNKILLNPSDFDKGLYLVSVKTSSTTYTTKVMRVD